MRQKVWQHKFCQLSSYDIICSLFSEDDFDLPDQELRKKRDEQSVYLFLSLFYCCDMP